MPIKPQPLAPLYRWRCGGCRANMATASIPFQILRHVDGRYEQKEICSLDCLLNYCAQMAPKPDPEEAPRRRSNNKNRAQQTVPFESSSPSAEAV